MTGHDDPKGHIEIDKDGNRFLKIDREVSEVEKRVEDFKADLADDGKRNYSAKKKK